MGIAFCLLSVAIAWLGVTHITVEILSAPVRLVGGSAWRVALTPIGEFLKTMNQKAGSKKKQHANLYGASLWPSEAQVWMDTAMRLDYESNRPQKDSHIDRNKLNVAHVCTGLAFELAYKSLLVAEFKPLERTHSVKKLHEMLKEEIRGIVEGYIKEGGWEDSTHLLEYLDEAMTHPDRKYWMENPWKRGRVEVGFVIGIETMTISGLAPILRKLVNLGV